MVKCLDKKFDKPDARAGARSLQRPNLLSAQCAAPGRGLFHKTNFPFQSKKRAEKTLSAFSARLRAVTSLNRPVSSLSVHGILYRFLIQCNIYISLHILTIFQRLYRYGNGCSTLIVFQHVG